MQLITQVNEIQCFDVFLKNLTISFNRVDKKKAFYCNVCDSINTVSKQCFKSKRHVFFEVSSVHNA